ncbi:unnamed protein product [Cyprideis torosa]|uniref:Uncharacterized protein n=1 Tax=Cyprideis torosa TaxID=163714 RepID=A0A7R8WLY2_9CRUS|nr:unnamed protein product [Cyprideis torosa]CAG0898645.1 unnamed protein product [Cyprideis torosa]
MLNLTSESLTSPLDFIYYSPPRTLELRKKKRPNKRYSGPMTLEKLIGLSFANTSGKWTSNIFLDPSSRSIFRLCYTLNDRDQYDRGATYEFKFKSEPYINMTWDVFLTSGAETLSSTIYDQFGFSTSVIRITSGGNYITGFYIEENQFLSTEDIPCDSSANYTYSKCIDDCLKHEFVSGEIQYDVSGYTRCQIFGFQDVEALEPCKTVEEAKDAETLSSTIYDQFGFSTSVIRITSGGNYITGFYIEENQFLSTEDIPCDSSANYTYSKCIDDCLKHEFVSGEIQYDVSGYTRCQIFGFQDVEALEPCKTVEEAKDVRYLERSL